MLSLEFVLGFCHGIARGGDCKVEFNQPFFGFIPCQFACNLALRNPVFRWESCNGSMWESVKKSSKVCNSTRPRNWISRLARCWQVAKVGTCVKHVEELKSHANCCITGQKSQVGQVVSTRLELATQSSHEAKSPDHFVWEKLTFCIPYTHQYKYPLYPCIVETFQREFWERNLRKKQDWLIHNLHPLIL